MKNVTFSVLAALALLSSPVLAAEQKDSGIMSLGRYGSWDTFVYEETGGKVCFMAAEPASQSSSNKSAKRSPAHLYITHWSVDGKKNIVSVTPGYAPAGQVHIEVDGQSSILFAENETAWTDSLDKDDALTAALQKGTETVVTATSKRGTKTTDTYALNGSADAYKAISKACGV